ncbi:uncharacterized protein LOC131663434 isoform X2 [Phymastichus coffea]|uniref:uncharacterized protein LOC131663434 isoform X2 n=1 Tax=Phymastichus coffea TaxID=108790 RepID=UPI00273C2100|nr:uncharacterized protein LOC131663434 isoform X2 [Phymastichus coffea]
MQTLRKKNSPCKLKNEPGRFMGEGVSFKAKLIGILEVSEARGDRMCQAALADLKMAIRAAGEHKQRITVQISIDGLRLRDEKAGDCLYHHPVHKISFIAQDMSDSRAFGYIFGSPDTGHRFFGIKTDKAASQVVIAMRDLFQVVFELKKKEIELAKQHIEHSAIRCGIYSSGRSPDSKGAAGSETSLHRTDSERSRKHDAQGGVVADLLGLQFELNSLQQGIHQMDKITPDNPGPVEDPFESDPFGDSFANMKIQEQVQPKLPPPPSSAKRGHMERQQTLTQTPASGTSSPANVTNSSNKTPPPSGSTHWFDKETEDLFNEGESSNLPRKNSSSDEDKEPPSTTTTQDRYKQLDLFSELDPLGTGIKKPYVDKRDFFQHLKNPPKKILKDLASTNSEDTFPTNFNITSDSIESSNANTTEQETSQFEDREFAEFDKFKDKDGKTSTEKVSPKPRHNDYNKRTIQHQSLSVSLPPEETSKNASHNYSMSTSITSSRCDSKDSSETTQCLVKLPSPKKYMHSSRKDYTSEYASSKSQSVDKSFPIDFSSTSDSPASPMRSCSSGANSRLSSSSAEMENVPEPPPRGAGSILINPPPLPPKKYSSRSGIKPPPRPPHGDGYFHYDFLEREETSPSPTRKMRGSESPKNSRSRFDDNFSPPLPQLPKRSDTSSFSNSSFEDSFNSIIQSPKIINTSASNKSDKNLENLTKDITLSQLTSTFLTDLAENLGMSVAEVTSLTLQQLTECIELLAKKDKSDNNKTSFSESILTSSKNVINDANANNQKSKDKETSYVSKEPLFKAAFDSVPKVENSNNYDKYAVFRELIEMEKADKDLDTPTSHEDEETITPENQEEPGELEDDAQSDEIDETIASLVNLTVKLPPVAENQSKEISTYYEMKSSEERSDSPKESEGGAPEEIESEDQYQSKDNLKNDELSSDSTKDVKIGNDDIKEKLEDKKTYDELQESSDTFVITAEEVNELSRIIHKKLERKSSITSSNDRYAALREIIEETEQVPLKDANILTSPNKMVLKSSAEVDLQGLFSDNFAQQTISISAKVTTKKDEDIKSNVMDIFEEIKMLNSDAHRTKDNKPLPSSNIDAMFAAFSDPKAEKEIAVDDDNWAQFETNTFQSDKSVVEGPGSFGGTSPWSPDGKEFIRETPLRRSIHRHSGESDFDWKDDESEESNGRIKGEGPRYSRHPRYDLPPFEEGPFYEEPVDEEKDRIFRERISRKTRGAPWIKGGHRPREPMSWHDEARWEEERRRHILRKGPYKNDEEYRTYWASRQNQRPWNGDREGFWETDHPFYEEDGKRRIGMWTDEERESRERFSSQESMGYDEDDRYYRREYDRRRYEDDRYRKNRGLEGPEYPPREAYKKHDPHYVREGRDRHYDYPPNWEEEYVSKRPEDSPRYLSRKKHWPKRPNSANEGREMIYMDARPKYAMSRSECSESDSDPYHRPYRSRSRDSYWGSDQEFESWGERSYWSENPDARGESLHRKRMSRHRGRPQPKLQSSQFEDDFTQSVDRNEPPIDPISAEPRIRSDIEMKQPTSPRSPRGVKDQGRKDPKAYKASSYFDDDLTPTASASSDASDRQRIGSDLKETPEELPSEVKDPVGDGFASGDSGRDSFFNGDPRFDDDAFVFRSELEDQVPDQPLKNSRHLKYSNSKGKGDQYIKKSESVNIFSRENDPFDDDEFFN